MSDLVQQLPDNRVPLQASLTGRNFHDEKNSKSRANQLRNCSTCERLHFSLPNLFLGNHVVTFVLTVELIGETTCRGGIVASNWDNEEEEISSESRSFDVAESVVSTQANYRVTIPTNRNVIRTVVNLWLKGKGVIRLVDATVLVDEVLLGCSLLNGVPPAAIDRLHSQLTLHGGVPPFQEKTRTSSQECEIAVLTSNDCYSNLMRKLQDSRHSHHRLLALGECSHEIEEFREKRNSLIRKFADDTNFRFVILEYPKLLVYQLNRYACGIASKPEIAGKLLGSYVVTSETIELVELIRNINKSRPDTPIELHGCDVEQSVELPIKTVLSSASRRPASFPWIRAKYENILQCCDSYRTQNSDYAKTQVRWELSNDQLEAARVACQDVERMISQNQELLNDSLLCNDIEWVMLCSRSIFPAVECAKRGFSSLRRDYWMFQNTKDVIDRYSRTDWGVLYAHLGHVANRPNRLGGLLKAFYGPQVILVGMTFGGVLQRSGQGEIDKKIPAPSSPRASPVVSSIESCIKGLKLGDVFFDCEPGNNVETFPIGDILCCIRRVGAGESLHTFAYGRCLTWFDGIYFLDTVTFAPLVGQRL